MRSSHTLDQLDTCFDDTHAIANAGLLLPATLAQRLGIEQAADQVIDLGDRPGAAHPGRKLLTLIHSMLAGGDCIDDANVLRCGQTASVLGHRVMAPSTLGTFLRLFTFGHVRQLDRVCETALTRVWAAGAGPGDGPMTKPAMGVARIAWTAARRVGGAVVTEYRVPCNRHARPTRSGGRLVPGGHGAVRPS